MLVWEVSSEVQAVVEEIKTKNHFKRLQEAQIAVSFNEGKPFVKGRFNWGKTSKFSSFAKIWHPKNKRYDFHISMPSDAWHSVLNASQREAWIDLHLTRCQVEYVPITVEEDGKKKPAKDEWGRVQYTEEIKRDDEGNPKWLVVPLDLNVFQENVFRYGCWCQDLLDFKAAIHQENKKLPTGYEQ